MPKTTHLSTMKLISQQRFHTEHLGFNDRGVIIDAKGAEYDGVRRDEHHIYTAVASLYGLSSIVNRIQSATQIGVEEEQHSRSTLYRTHEGYVFEVVELSNISGLLIRDLSEKSREQSGKYIYGIGAIGEFGFRKAFGRAEIPSRDLPSANPYGHYNVAGYRMSILTQPIISSLIAVPTVPRAWARVGARRMVHPKGTPSAPRADRSRLSNDICNTGSLSERHQRSCTPASAEIKLGAISQSNSSNIRYVDYLGERL